MKFTNTDLSKIDNHILSNWKNTTVLTMSQTMQVSQNTIRRRCKVLDKVPITSKDLKISFLLNHSHLTDREAANQMDCSSVYVRRLRQEMESGAAFRNN